MPRRVLHDQYFRQAKAEGYLARSAYKLRQIQEAKRLIRRGDRVLDLGCAPGAWTQVAGEIAGAGGDPGDGLIVGLDLQEIRHPFGPGVHHLVGDVYSVDPAELRGESGRLFDVILSDMAPSTSGHNDDLLSARLCDRVLGLLPELLRRGGGLAMKVLEGSEYPRLLRDSALVFEAARGFKPKASREVSREVYIVGQSYAGEG